MKKTLRFHHEGPTAIPVARYAVALFLVLAALVSVVAVTLDRNARRSNWQQSVTALAGSAQVGASTFRTVRSDLRVEASQLATSLALQRAIVTHNQAEVRRIAADRHARIVLNGRAVGTLAPAPRVVSTATIADGVHVLARVTVALPLGVDVLTLIRRATPLPPHAALVLVRDGHVVAGGPVGARAKIIGGRISFGRAAFAAQGASLGAASASVLAIEPDSALLDDGNLTLARKRKSFDDMVSEALVNA